MDQRPTIIVTGASSGIGAHAARALKTDGWRVFASVRREEDRALLEAEGIESFLMDYTDPASIHALADAVLARTGGRLDALYNNGWRILRPTFSGCSSRPISSAGTS
jgi:NAD(P)-dependent dehydrogenase (short-subunit alcohol dehydrogenase family)